MRPFVLASASPRRLEILKNRGYNFTVMPSEVDETVPKRLETHEIPRYLAEKKARAVADKTGLVTLGSDTIVVFDGVILGKPKDRAENAEFLKKLSGKTHVVLTGYCIIDKDKVFSGVESAAVKFNELSAEKIAEYVKSGNGLDKAGGYGIQDGFSLVESIDGEYETVVGLPIKKVSEILEKVL